MVCGIAHDLSREGTRRRFSGPSIWVFEQARSGFRVVTPALALDVVAACFAAGSRGRNVLLRINCSSIKQDIADNSALSNSVWGKRREREEKKDEKI